jgi:hypothetical protein
LLSACGGGAFLKVVIAGSGVGEGIILGNTVGAGSSKQSGQSIIINKINHANKRNPVLLKQNIFIQPIPPKIYYSKLCRLSYKCQN